MAREWCRTSRDEFVENIVWRIKFRPPRASIVEYYGMNDGSVVYSGQLYYTPDTWCSVYDFENGLKKILDDLKSGKVKVVYISGSIPKELAEEAEKLQNKMSVVKAPLPSI